MAASDPHSPLRFWRDLEALNAKEGLEHALHRMVEAHGYLETRRGGAQRLASGHDAFDASREFKDGNLRFSLYALLPSVQVDRQ